MATVRLRFRTRRELRSGEWHTNYPATHHHRCASRLWSEGELPTVTKTSLACQRCWERPRWALTSVGTWHTTGWYGPNASNGPGSVGQVFAGAGNSGGYWPFWDTRANRLAAGDPRPSLEERYGTHAGYVCVVTRAVNKAIQQRFLLPSEAPTVIANAAASNVLAAPFVPTPKDTQFCQYAVHQYEVPPGSSATTCWMADQGNLIRHLFCPREQRRRSAGEFRSRGFHHIRRVKRQLCACVRLLR